MKRRLKCTECGKEHIIVGESVALSFSPRDMLCWTCDPALKKILNKETLIAEQISALQAEKGN